MEPFDLDRLHCLSIFNMMPLAITDRKSRILFLISESTVEVKLLGLFMSIIKMRARLHGTG